MGASILNSMYFRLRKTRNSCLWTLTARTEERPWSTERALSMCAREMGHTRIEFNKDCRPWCSRTSTQPGVPSSHMSTSETMWYWYWCVWRWTVLDHGYESVMISCARTGSFLVLTWGSRRDSMDMQVWSVPSHCQPNEGNEVHRIRTNRHLQKRCDRIVPRPFLILAAWCWPHGVSRSWIAT